MSVFVVDTEQDEARSRVRRLLREWLGGWAGPLLVFYGLVALGHVFYCIFQWGGDEHAAAVSDWIAQVAYSGPFLFAWRTWRHPGLPTRTRRAWLLITLAYLGFFIGQCLWTYYELGLGVAPFPSLADTGFLAFYPLMLLSLLFIVDRLSSSEERLGFFLDSAIVCVSAGVIVWYFLLEPIARSSDGNSLKTVLALAYPIGDIVLLLGITSLILRCRALAGNGTITLLMIGVAGNFIADLLFSHSNLLGTYKTGDFIGSLYTVSLFPIIVAAHYQYILASRGSIPEQAPAGVSTKAAILLPYIAIALAYAVLVVINVMGEEFYPGIDVAAALSLTALIVMRQYLFIREAKRANAAVSDLQERIQGIYSAASDGIGVAGFDGRLLEVNDAFVQMMGYSREELVGGMRYDDLTPEHFANATRQAVQKAIETDAPVEYEKEFCRKDETRYNAAITVFPIKSRDGKPTALAAIVRDITERKRTEALLREAEERWQLALRVNYDGIWDWDLQKKVFYYSPRWREMFGYGETEEIPINSFNSYEFFHPDDIELSHRLREQMISGETPYFDTEFRHICKDGSFKWIRCRGLAIRNHETGRLDRVIGLDTDISVRKRNEFESKAIDTVLKGVSETSDLDELLVLIHKALSEVVYAENCYVALYVRNTDMLSIPFCRDKFDEPAPPSKLGRGLTAYVLRTGEPQLLSSGQIQALTDSGSVAVVGTMPAIWLGVPLRTPTGIVGALVIQHYDNATAYDDRDAAFLDAIGHHIAFAIDRKLSEIALRSSETQLREAQRIAHIGSWEWDLIASDITWSDELFEIFGLTPSSSDSSAKKFLEICHPDDRDRVEKEVGKALETHKFEPLDHRIVRPNGEVRFIHTNAELVVDINQKPIKLVGTSQDITDRKNVESRMRLQTVALESAANGVVITDGNGDIEWVNPAFTLLTGYELNEVVGTNPRFLKSGKNPDTLYKELWETITNGKIWQGELVNKAKDGHLYDEEMTITPVMNGDGSVEHFIAIKRDISERKRSEAALRLSEEQHRLLFESNPFPVYVYDTETLRFLAVNKATVDHYGYSRKELLNDLTLKDIRPAEDHDELVRRVAAVSFEKDTMAAPSRHQKKDGTVVQVEITSHLMNFGGRRAEIVLVNDVTERQLAEEQLRIFNQRLQQSNRELQDFAYVASHDLQEPLRKVQTFADRLGSKYSDRLDETGLDYLGRMSNAANRMQTLIQDLLSFSRVTTKAQPFASVDLEQITKDVLSDLEVKIEETAATVETHDLPQLDADPVQMRQLLQNLIGNALKFRKADVSPHIVISATNGRSNLNGPMYTITVEDNGIGFDEKYIDKIFTVFQRLHGRAEYEGSGIGLAVCRKIVERHSGTITATSTPGNGSKFIFTLPANQSNAEVHLI